MAREWSGHGDGRVYGGVVNPTDDLAGVLGSYEGCLVEARSRTLIVLTGAMEFHQPDGHSPRQHVYSKALLGDGPASVIPLGERFRVEGIEVASLPDTIRLESPIPERCSALRVFLTTTETFKPMP